MYPACAPSFTLSCQRQIERRKRTPPLCHSCQHGQDASQDVSLNDGSYSAYKQGKNLLVLWYMQAATRWKKQNLFTCSKCWEGRNHRINTDHKINIWSSFTPTSVCVSGFVGDQFVRPTAKETSIPCRWQHRPGIYWYSADTTLQWELLFWSMIQHFKEDYTNFPALSIKVLVYSCDCGKFVAFIHTPKGSRD